MGPEKIFAHDDPCGSGALCGEELNPLPPRARGAGFRGLTTVAFAAAQQHVVRIEQRTAIRDLDDVVAEDADTLARVVRIVALILAAPAPRLDEMPHQGFPFGGQIEWSGRLLPYNHSAAVRWPELLTEVSQPTHPE